MGEFRAWWCWGKATDKGNEASPKLSQGALFREHLQTANNTMFLPDFLKCSQSCVFAFCYHKYSRTCHIFSCILLQPTLPGLLPSEPCWTQSGVGAPLSLSLWDSKNEGDGDMGNRMKKKRCQAGLLKSDTIHTSRFTVKCYPPSNRIWYPCNMIFYSQALKYSGDTCPDPVTLDGMVSFWILSSI